MNLSRCVVCVLAPRTPVTSRSFTLIKDHACCLSASLPCSPYLCLTFPSSPLLLLLFFLLLFVCNPLLQTAPLPLSLSLYFSFFLSLSNSLSFPLYLYFTLFLMFFSSFFLYSSSSSLFSPFCSSPYVQFSLFFSLPPLHPLLSFHRSLFPFPSLFVFLRLCVFIPFPFDH